jgi:hypothetical protein
MVIHRSFFLLCFKVEIPPSHGHFSLHSRPPESDNDVGKSSKNKNKIANLTGVLYENQIISYT